MLVVLTMYAEKRTVPIGVDVKLFGKGEPSEFCRVTEFGEDCGQGLESLSLPVQKIVEDNEKQKAEEDTERVQPFQSQRIYISGEAEYVEDKEGKNQRSPDAAMEHNSDSDFQHTPKVMKAI